MSLSPNPFAYGARHLLSQYHGQHMDIPNNPLSELRQVLHNPAPAADLPVGIIGAGAAGLYTAMIFESLGTDYQIIDADTPERVGGRLFTHHFSDEPGSYDYFDIGAMRFPDTPFMKRTFDLARNRGLPVKLIPYIRETSNSFLFFNNERIMNQDSDLTEDDPFDVSGYVDPSLASPAAVSQKVADVIKPFRDLFVVPDSSGNTPDIATAMAQLFNETDMFSMRSYMFQGGMRAEDISWCETLDKSTGWYDRALTETVLESLAFDWPTSNTDPNAPWHCFDGGSSTLPKAMFGSLSKEAQANTLFRSPVTAIAEDTETKHMKIWINGKQSPQEYSSIISTVPLPRLSLMNLTGVDINGNYGQWSAIRELQYGPSIKVGLRFSEPWWETKLGIHGGQSFTDLPVRTIVYPSYPANATAAGMSNTLIATYCWTQDAERMGSFINRDGTGEPELLDLIFRDLAAVHDVSVEWLRGFYKDGDYFAWDWLHNSLTMGAFAFFGPGVYGNGDIYSQILLPAASGKLFFAGEAASTCHAWVAGALDSAWRAVDQYLTINQDTLPPGTRDKFYELWGETEYWDEASDKDLVERNRKLMDRHLVIGLHKSGARIPAK